MASPPSPAPPTKQLPSPPPTEKALPSPPSLFRIKSPSFSSRSNKSGEDDKSDTGSGIGSGSGNGGGTGRFSQKMKDLFGKEKRQNSSSSLPIDAIQLDDTMKKSPSMNFQLAAQPETLSYILTGDTKHLPSDFHKDDGFALAVQGAEKACERLETASFWLNGAAGILAGGAGWVPMVGEAAKAVVAMLDSAKRIAVAKVAALRLVERCARILEAVINALKRHDGKLSDGMRGDVDRLLYSIHGTADLLSKLAERPLFKLWLHSNEVFDQIEEANKDLKSFFDIFHVDSTLTGNALLEQIRKDREVDMKILQDLLEAGMRDESLMLNMLVKKNDEQQEAIKTIQRALDALLAINAPRENEAAPGSPTTLDSPTFQVPPRPWHPPLTPSPSTEDEVSTRATEATPDEPDPRRVFLEKALDVLRRHSAASDYGVPDWTITSLEVYYEKRLTTSFFSEVWKGRWQGEAVAIKDLNSVVSRELFIQEVEVWRRLKSRHVLPFLGASSTTGPPPWFLVSPYLQNGNILSYLSSTPLANRLALIHQISQGLEYLHSRDIIHGDFKAANVLITDIGEAVICDFGMSQLKMEVSTKSSHKGKGVSGTMRWQAPERLSGGSAGFATDVYSFAITICELYSPEVPFGYVDDEVVRKNIIGGARPARPPGVPTNLWELVNRCWAQDPKARPTFEVIANRLEKMYEAPKRAMTEISTTSTASSSSYTTASEGGWSSQGEQHAMSPVQRAKLLPDDSMCSSSSGSIISIPPHLEKELSFESDRAERHYRHYLQHDFDDRLTIPLWFPSHVPLGSVGYIRHGEFVKLLDATRPPVEGKSLPPMVRMDEWNALQSFTMPIAVRNAAERGWDLINSAVASFVRSSGETAQKTISRKLLFPLKPGMKRAALVVDEGEFTIYKTFAEARAYLTANIDWILDTYGDAHHLAREDVILVVGTLKAQNWAMVVSNFAPRTTLTFNVHAEASRKGGEPWGTWTVNRAPGVTAGAGTSHATYSVAGAEQKTNPRVDDHGLKYTCKVSTVASTPMEAVLLAKLRFAPGSDEPTLYP